MPFSLDFGNPISDAVSKVNFAPQSNNLLISSWEPSLRLYDVDCSVLKFEAPCDAPLLDCCFQSESVAFSAGSDGGIRRYTFRCFPKSIDGKGRLVSINDIAFSSLSHGTFVTGDNEGYVIGWDFRSKKRLYEFPRCPNSVASLSYNNTGELLAIASSHTYQEANEMKDAMSYCSTTK